MNSVQTNCFCQSYILVTFVNTVPLDRDEKNNKTDTFEKIKFRSSR